MNQPGLGVMIQMLSGDRGGEFLKSAIGKKIVKASIVKDDSDCLRLLFDDGTGIEFFDNGQSCCEQRYMVTDDKPEDIKGATLMDAEILGAPEIDDGDGESHEVQFLVIRTSLGVLTVSNHNRHNGYYGGFWIAVRECERVEPKKARGKK